MILSHFLSNAEGDLVPTKSSILDPPPQEVHLTPAAPKEQGQSPDLTGRDQNHHYPEGEGLNPFLGSMIQDTAVAETQGLQKVGRMHSYILQH